MLIRGNIAKWQFQHICCQNHESKVKWHTVAHFISDCCHCMVLLCHGLCTCSLLPSPLSRIHCVLLSLLWRMRGWAGWLRLSRFWWPWQMAHRGLVNRKHLGLLAQMSASGTEILQDKEIYFRPVCIIYLWSKHPTIATIEIHVNEVLLFSTSCKTRSHY